MIRRLIPVSAWLVLVAIAFVTLSPIGLRPHSMLSANWERLLSFLVVGALFALAYPRHLLVIVALVLGAAAGFEALQLVASGRHAQFSDMGIKMIGGGIGIAFGALVGQVTGLARRTGSAP